ncbi:AAA family ATPase [Nocardioides sp. C4-1]|uniref:ATP-binding protein n=1 Tax=Nocardioides sp. C4-1 TaxID=3151851 RepID=UPI0032636A9F
MPDGPRPLVERETELHQSTTLLDRAIGGQGGAFCILGAAGVGKTALVRRIASDAAARGALSLVATAHELETQAPFGVVRQLLDSAVATLDDDEREQVTGGPARLAADLLTLAAPDRPVEQSALFASLFWLVDGLVTVSRCPLVLVVDDAQWADEASLLFLRHLLARLDDRPVLVVVAARDVHPDRRSPALAALVARRDGTVARLRPLSDDGVHALLESVWGPGVSAEVTAACAEVTGGNPFLVSTLADLVGGAGVEAIREAVPGSVVDSVMQRLSALPPLDRDVGRWVAVLDSAPARLVTALTGSERGDTLAASDRLRDAGLLADGERLEFRHALLRAAVYSSIPPGARSDLHRRAARAVAAEPDGLHQAAGQLLRADGEGDPWVVDLLVTAAAATTDSGAPEAAVRLLERAVAEPAPAAEAPVVLLQLGLAQLRAGDAACVVTLERAERAVTDPAQRAHCALALTIAYNFAGFYPRSAELLARVLDGLGPEHGDLALVVEAGLVSAALQVPELVDDARRRLDARRGLTGATPGERMFLAQQASYANSTDEPLARVLELVRLAIGHGLTSEQHPESHEWAVTRLQLAATGEYAEVVDLCEQGLEFSAAAGSVVGFVAGSLVRGIALLWAGDLAGAELDLRAVLTHADLIPGGTLVGPLASAFLAEVLLERGEVEQARSLLLDGVATDSSFNGGIHVLRARGLVAAATGDHAGALRELDECGRRLAALQVDSPTWCSWRPAAVASHWALGDVATARAVSADDVVHATRKEADVALGIALRVAGEVSVESLPLLTRSVDVLAGTQARLEHARSQVALGAALRRSGRRAEARDLLLAARVQAAHSGADALRARADDELAAAGARPRRVQLSGAGALTASERRVCALAASGLRNRDVAQRLFISTKTVEIHLSRAYRKLGITRRDQLGAALAPSGGTGERTDASDPGDDDRSSGRRH